MRRRTWLALILSGFLAVGLTPQWSEAQAVVTAQILNFARLLLAGGAFSGLTLSYSDLSIITSGYANFGTVLGANGYGFRDNGGTIQGKNQNGSWATLSGGADPNGTYIIQTTNTGLPKSQALGSLGSGLMSSLTGTGVVSIYVGTTCTNQFLTALTGAGVGTCAGVDLSNATQATGTMAAARFPALTGDVTTVAGAVATTLATVNTNVGSWGTSTAIAQFTVNGKGLITAAANVTPQLTLTGTYFSSLSGASLTAIPTTALTGALAAANFPALTGDVTSAGASLATVVAKIGGNAVSIGGALTFSGAFTTTITVTNNTTVTLPTTGTLVNSAVATLSSLTSVGTLGTGVWQATPVVPQYGGTGLATITAHALMVGEGTSTVVPVAGCTNGVAWWSLASSDPLCQVSPIVTNSGATSTEIVGGTGVAGAATTVVKLTKSVTGIADASATPVFTVSVPNAAHAAVVRVLLAGSLGAGGAIGAFECTSGFVGDVVVQRTANVATVATASSAAINTFSCGTGATTITFAYSVSGNTGANNATQTFTINVTITKGGGGSNNHSVVAYAELLNSQVTGITIS